MGWWGDIKEAASDAWEAGKDVVGGVWHVIDGTLSRLTNIVKNTFSRLSLIWEIPLLYVFGYMPKKKLKLRVLILSDERGNLLAKRDQVEDAVAIAKEVFKSQLNIRIEGVNGDIVRELIKPAPSYVLEQPCAVDSGSFFGHLGSLFWRAGAWYRSRLARTPGGTFFGHGTPITIFVIRDVQGQDTIGCGNSAWFENYGFIEPVALPPDGPNPRKDAEYTTLPHEIGHCCDLIHRKPKKNLMYRGDRTGVSLTKWQKVIVRTCTHVTYL